MEEALMKSILNFGIFPAVTIYLVFLIIKDFRDEIKYLKSSTDKNYKEISNQYFEISKSVEELVHINEQMQNYIMNYLNSLLIKLLDVLDDIDDKKNY